MQWSLINTLIDNGADVTICGKEGNTLLHCAVKRNEEIDQVFFEKLAHSANIPDNSGCIPLHSAVKRNQKLAEILLDKGRSKTQINAKESNGNTPLHFAYEEGHQEMIQFLIKNGADQQLKNSSGMRPCDMGKKVE